MTLANLILICAWVINLILIAFVVFNKEQKHRLPVLLLIILVTLWQSIELINVFFLRFSDHLLLGARFGLLPNLFIAPAFLWLVFSLCDRCQIVKKYTKILVWLPAIIMIPFLFSNYNISSVTVTENGFIFQQEVLYYYFLAYFLLVIGFALTFLAKMSKKVNLIIKKQISYIFFGTALTAVFALLFSVVLPLFGLKNWFYLGVDSAVFFTLVLVYALARFRFWDLKQLFLKIALDAIAFFSTLFVFYFLFLLLLRFVKIDFMVLSNQLAFVLLIGFSSPLVYQAIYKFLNYFGFNPQQKIELSVIAVADVLRSGTDLNILFSRLTKVIAQVIDYQDMFVYLAKHNNPEVFHQVYPVGERILALNDSQLLQFLVNHPAGANKAEIQYLQTDRYLAESMDKQKIDFALPIFYNQQLLGLVMIDAKQRFLSAQQLQFLSKIKDYLDIAIGSFLLANK
ncbi:MAG: hypothetical protein UR94_C0002G0022 [Parcubacteria group bacterium GW2011_GWA2_36_10]|nr:MAG: hypothetical protein UR94_C0002G0022 [Parcubacteria group bacterium GW2011_GWA2_36_10]